MGKSKTSGIFTLHDWRLSFPRLWKPKAFQEGQEPRFEASFLGDPTNATHQEEIKILKELAKKLIRDTWGEKPGDLKLCFGLADENPTKAKYEGYKGMFYLVTANTSRPTVANRSRVAVVEGEKEAPFDGCYVVTRPTLWTQDNKFGKAVRCNLRIVQFSKPGPAFSGSAPASAEDELEMLGDKSSASGGGGATPVDDEMEL